MRCSWSWNGPVFLLTAIGFALSSPGRAAEAPPELRLTPWSAVGFKAKTTFHDFEEKAARASGTLQVVDGRPAKGHVSCSVTDLKSDEAARDKTMWGPGYLNSAQFPAIEFTFASLDGPASPAAGDATGTVHGTLRVRDRELPVAAPVTYRSTEGGVEITGSFPLDIRKAGFEPPVVAVIQRMDATIVITFALRFVQPGAK